MDDATKLLVTLARTAGHTVVCSHMKKLGLKEHPLFPKDLWIAAVGAGLTERSYEEWWSAKTEEAFDAFIAPPSPSAASQAVSRAIKKTSISGAAASMENLIQAGENYS